MTGTWKYRLQPIDIATLVYATAATIAVVMYARDHDFGDRRDVLHLLRRVPVLSGRGAAVPVRPAAQRGHRRVAGARGAVDSRHRRLVGRRVPVVPRRGLRRRDRDGVVLFAASGVDPGAVHRRPDSRRGVRAVPLRGGCIERAAAGGRRAGGDAAPGHPRAGDRSRDLSGGWVWG